MTALSWVWVWFWQLITPLSYFSQVFFYKIKNFFFLQWVNLYMIRDTYLHDPPPFNSPFFTTPPFSAVSKSCDPPSVSTPLLPANFWPVPKMLCYCCCWWWWFFFFFFALVKFVIENKSFFIVILFCSDERCALGYAIQDEPNCTGTEILSKVSTACVVRISSQRIYDTENPLLWLFRENLFALLL